MIDLHSGRASVPLWLHVPTTAMTHDHGEDGDHGTRSLPFLKLAKVLM
jgi:hypothetical protein